jgi:hypothetical protein
LFKYKIDRSAPLPTAKEKLVVWNK